MSANTKQEELIERLEDKFHISFCDFEPQKNNDLNCAVCNERKWDVHHVALSVVQEEVTAVLDELEKQKKDEAVVRPMLDYTPVIQVVPLEAIQSIKERYSE